MFLQIAIVAPVTWEKSDLGGAATKCRQECVHRVQRASITELISFDRGRIAGIASPSAAIKSESGAYAWQKSRK